MASVNKAIIVGNLVADPEIRHSRTGNPVANIRIATNERWKDKDGNNQERVEFHRIVVWGKTAENCATYLSKGSAAYVEGKLQTREWQDSDGSKRFTTEIVATQVQFLNSRSTGVQGTAQSGGYGGGGYGAPDQQPPIDDVDVPF